MIRFDSPECGRIWIVGHTRAPEALAPENSGATLHRGDEAAADLLDLDVPLTRDGELFTGDYCQALRLGVDAVTASNPRAARQVLERQNYATDEASHD